MFRRNVILGWLSFWKGGCLQPGPLAPKVQWILGKSFSLLASIFSRVTWALCALTEPCSPQGFLLVISTYTACHGLQSTLLALAALVLFACELGAIAPALLTGKLKLREATNLAEFLLWVNGRA